MPQGKQAPSDCDFLKQLIREVPDFPKPGILFYDITTLLKDKVGFAKLVDSLGQCYIGRRVDLVATGGTALATTKLVESLGGKVASLAFIVELDFLKGRDKLAGHEVVSLLHYDK